jgi:hypothetical protein
VKNLVDLRGSLPKVLHGVQGSILHLVEAHEGCTNLFCMTFPRENVLLIIKKVLPEEKECRDLIDLFSLPSLIGNSLITQNFLSPLEILFCLSQLSPTCSQSGFITFGRAFTGAGLSLRDWTRKARSSRSLRRGVCRPGLLGRGRPAW